ncbi:hypothetical protein GH733_011485 [Mirounga leonina]|nr:hypothetical protein GH733_011485 [Mirounga leonina]
METAVLLLRTDDIISGHKKEGDDQSPRGGAPMLARKCKVHNNKNKKNLQHYDISAKSRYNFEKPFLWLSRKLTGDPNLESVIMPALAPPEAAMDATSVAQCEHDLEVSQTTALAAEHDDPDAVGPRRSPSPPDG